MNVGQAIYSILSGDSTLTTLVDGRIYPERATDLSATPYVVYSIQSVSPYDTKSGTSVLDEASVEVYAVGPDYGDLMAIVNAVRNALDRVSGNFGDAAVQSCNFVDEQADFEPVSREYIVQQTYDFRLLRAGSAPVSDLASVQGILIEDDNLTDSTYCTKIVFPDDNLSISDRVATITMGTGSADFDFLALELSAAKLNGGASALSFDQADTDIAFDTTAVDLSDTMQTSLNGIRVPSGTYIVRLVATAVTDSNNVAPHFKIEVGNTREIGSEATCFITGTHGDTHATASTCFLYASAGNETLEVVAYNHASANNSFELSFVQFSLQKVA